MPGNLLAVAIGGALGASARYLLGLLPVKPQGGFPLITFLINVAGAFAIGLIAAASAKNTSVDPRLILFLKVGICGGFTTFSTFSLETMNLLQSGRNLTAFLYIISSVTLGTAAVFAAEKIA